jgi:hypothetical protein
MTAIILLFYFTQLASASDASEETGNVCQTGALAEAAIPAATQSHKGTFR